jgi:uncharacterized protein YdaU (DUF1376 family)
MTKRTTKEFPIANYLKGAELLSYDELGVYIRLLEYMWISHGKIPNNDEKIAHFLRLKIKKWQNYKKTLQDFFVFSKTSMFHPTMQAEHEKLASKAKQNALNASRRWNPKSISVQDRVSSEETKNMRIA